MREYATLTGFWSRSDTQRGSVEIEASQRLVSGGLGSYHTHYLPDLWTAAMELIKNQLNARGCLENLAPLVQVASVVTGEPVLKIIDIEIRCQAELAENFGVLSELCN